jgi:cytochrome c-type biogenesis protein CcmH
MRHRRTLSWLAVVAVAITTLVVATQVEGPPRTNEDRVRALSEDFACPTCDGQSIAESNAVVAQEIRREIRRQVDAGASDEEITDALIAGYDESIDLRPRASGVVGLVWVLPVFVSVFAGAGLVVVFSRWQRASVRHASPEDEAIVARLRADRSDAS